MSDEKKFADCISGMVAVAWEGKNEYGKATIQCTAFATRDEALAWAADSLAQKPSRAPLVLLVATNVIKQRESPVVLEKVSA